MANTPIELPQTSWDLIGTFADVVIPDYMSVERLPQVCEVEADRRAALLIEQALSSIPPAVENADYLPHLRPRGQLVQYAGLVSPTVSQHASLYEVLLRMRHNHDQYFPMTVVIDDVIHEVNPEFNPMAHIDQALTPIHQRDMTFLEQHYGLALSPNPLTYRYLWRFLGPSAESLPGHLYKSVRAKRKSVLMIKAYFYGLVIAGMIPSALAEGGDEPNLNKYQQLWRLVVGVMRACLVLLIDSVLRVCSCINLDWYRALSQPAQASVDLVSLAALVYVLVLVTKRKTLNLVAARVLENDRFLGQVLTEAGMVYKVRVNGKELTLSADDGGISCHQDEMAMPGSEYFPCRKQPVGALLVTTNNTDLQIFGTFWRLDDYLVTARHCSNTLNQSTARVYLAKIKETKRGNYEVDRSDLYRAPDDFFAPEENVIAAYDVDAFARYVEPKIWSQIGLTQAPTKVRSSYGQQVHSVGFTTDGLLVSASGKTLPDSGFEQLHHTASTQKGFSGSILLCGNSVVGMHVSAAGEHNVAVRTELIKYLIDAGCNQESYSKNRKKYTYADASYKEFYRQQKWRGGVVDLKRMRDGKFAIVLSNGEATYGWDVGGLVECFGPTGHPDKDADYFEDLVMDSIAPKLRSRGQYVDYDDDRYHRNSYENASIIGSVQKVRKGKKNPSKSPVKKDTPAQPFTIVDKGKPVHGPSAPKVQPEATQVIEDHIDEIVELGYEAGAFAYPDMSPETERKSLENHLKLYSDRVKTVTVPPTDVESSRCARLVAEMLQPASFVPRSNYNTLEGVLDIINSSIICPKKAAGYPYCLEGKPTNGQVLEQFGERGFAQHVLNGWNDLVMVVKTFLKGEPTKKKKLDADMPRNVAGFPLHVTVKHASIFDQLTTALVKQWKKIPVKYAFSPGNPGHIEHLADSLPGPVWESDKTNWDYMMYPWIANTCRDTIKLLAVKPADWTDDQFNQYLVDIDNCFKQVFEEALYRTSNGSTYKMDHAGIMKSGWYLTIAVNSIAQLEVHVMTCIRLGMSDDDILSTPIVAGGDDVNQAPVPAGKAKYVEEAAKLGVVMEIHERESIYHAEYFSSDLRLGVEGPEYFPKRWTKHIEHLRVIKRADLADALVSHMENYRHHSRKFNLLAKMYLALEEKYPNEFPKHKLVSRALLRARQYGYEHALVC